MVDPDSPKQKNLRTGINRPKKAAPLEGIFHWQGIHSHAPEISVLVPCWHGEKTIGAALDSIENQKGLPDQLNIEIVVIADGRKEDGLAIRNWIDNRQSAPRWNVTLLELHKNIGSGGARHTGYSYCKGRFLAFLDDDDVWHPDKIARQWGWHQDNLGQVISAHGYGEVKREANVKLIDLLLGTTPLPTPTLMINMHLWAHKPEPYRYGEDWLMLAMAACWQPIKLLPWNLAKRNPEAPSLLNDKYSLSRQRLKLRTTKIISILRLVKRGRLNPVFIPALVALNILLLVRRFALDMADLFLRKLK